MAKADKLFGDSFAVYAENLGGLSLRDVRGEQAKNLLIHMRLFLAVRQGAGLRRKELAATFAAKAPNLLGARGHLAEKAAAHEFTLASFVWAKKSEVIETTWDVACSQMGQFTLSYHHKTEKKQRFQPIQIRH